MSYDLRVVTSLSYQRICAANRCQRRSDTLRTILWDKGKFLYSFLFSLCGRTNILGIVHIKWKGRKEKELTPGQAATRPILFPFTVGVFWPLAWSFSFPSLFLGSRSSFLYLLCGDREHKEKEEKKKEALPWTFILWEWCYAHNVHVPTLPKELLCACTPIWPVSSNLFILFLW